MLTYEALIEEAKLRGMPPAKMRGILREYLQILILKEIYKIRASRKLLFTGGTFLRLIHNLKRFSEDLDFNTSALGKEEFEGIIAWVSKGLEREGVRNEVKFSHQEKMFIAKLGFPEIEKQYGVISKFSRKKGIIIKIEASVRESPFSLETSVISGFGMFFPCVCTFRGILFADKIDAFVKKRRGRDIYDVMFMLSRKFPVDRKFLSYLGIKGDPLEVLKEEAGKISVEELERQAEILKPFLFDEEEAEMVKRAYEIIPLLVERYY